jgi:hypothetical protein
MPEIKKNSVPETQIAMAGAAVLNRILWRELLRRFVQNAMIRHSRRTVTAPAEAPKSKTEAKTNVSETDR